MAVHASPDELPALKAFLGNFQVRFRRPEGAEPLARYTTGLPETGFYCASESI